MTKVYLIDVTCFQNASLQEAVRASLSPRRLEKADSFRREQDKLLSLGAGAALDMALSSVGLRERDVPWALGPHGKPFLPDHPGVCFSLSHSGRFSVCALSGQEVGADVQELRAVTDPLLQKTCTPRELQSFHGLTQEERLDRFFRLWTGKESFLKLLGSGLSLSLTALEIDLGPAPALRFHGEPQETALFQRRLDGHWLSVCASRPEQVVLRAPAEQELAAFFKSGG